MVACTGNSLACTMHLRYPRCSRLCEKCRESLQLKNEPDCETQIFTREKINMYNYYYYTDSLALNFVYFLFSVLHMSLMLCNIYK